MQRGGPVADGDGILYATKSGKAALELVEKMTLRGDPRASQTFHDIVHFVAGKIGSRHGNADVGRRCILQDN